MARKRPHHAGDDRRQGVGVVKLIAGVGKAERSLCIGEGIETALSFAHLPRAKGATIWAGVNANNMARLEPLDAFDSVMIAVDIDPSGAGAEAAKTLAARWALAGKRVFLLWPALPQGRDKFDLNDLARVEGGPIEGTHYRIEKFEAPKDGGAAKGPPVNKSSKADARFGAVGDNSGERNTELGNAHRLVHQHGDDICSALLRASFQVLVRLGRRFLAAGRGRRDYASRRGDH